MNRTEPLALKNCTGESLGGQASQRSAGDRADCEQPQEPLTGCVSEKVTGVSNCGLGEESMSRVTKCAKEQRLENKAFLEDST